MNMFRFGFIKSVFLQTFCVMVVFLFSSCATTDFKNMESIENVQLLEDEKYLWDMVTSFQKKILDSDFICDDDVLTMYVNSVLEKISQPLVQDLPFDLKVYIVEDPNFNAMAYPNGIIFVHTGLLSHVENEAQLATILAHELAHVLHRHLLKEQNNKINTTTFWSFIQVASVGVTHGLTYGGYDAGGFNLIRHYAGFGGLASIYGYSRELEKEADEYGFAWMKKAGYNPQESKKVFQNLYNISKEEKNKNLIPFFYQSHPKIKKRIKAFDSLLKDMTASGSDIEEGIVNEDVYMQKVKPLLLVNAFSDVKRDKNVWAKRQLDKYNKYFTQNAESLYIESEILLGEKKMDEAIEILMEANVLDDTNTDVIKRLGLLKYKQGDKENASVWFRKFLTLNPQSMDADFIRGYLDE